jgi:hypothetical protein
LVAVQSHHQHIAEFSRRRQVTHMADVQNIEATIRRDSLACPQIATVPIFPLNSSKVIIFLFTLLRLRIAMPAAATRKLAGSFPINSPSTLNTFRVLN